MKKILIIQSRARPEMVAAEQGEYIRAAAERAELSFVSSLDESLLWSEPERMLQGYSGVILGGSGEFDFDGGRDVNDTARIASQHISARVRPFIEYIFENDFPLLGICYGHQIIAEVLGVPVINDSAQRKVGSFEVVLTEEGKTDALFKNMPERFMAQYGHKDSLSGLPPGATVLASSPLCKFSALRYGLRRYTTQFHPELTAEDVRWKLQNSPGYLPEGVDMESIIKQSVEASTLIPRFIEQVAF